MKAKKNFKDMNFEPQKMRAVMFKNHGDIDQLEHTYAEIPHVGPHEVLVKVKACALNHLDLWTLMGMPGIKVPLPHILGCDIAGEVVQRGSQVKGIPMKKPVIVAPGISCGKCSFCKSGWDSLCPEYHIMGFQVNGGYAEYVKAPARNIIPVNRRLSFEEWAAIPLVHLTAWHMLVTRAGLQKGETCLIHAAGSGVGSAAIQLARHLGARIITTVGTDEKIRRAKAIGAHEVINYQKKDFLAEVKKITDGRGVDVVLEHIGPATFTKSMACLAKKGRMVTCGATSGPTVSLDLRYLFVKQLSLSGCYMGSVKELRKVVSLVRKKKLRPVIDEIFPLREARQALKRLQRRANFGKIILVP
ncbi:MAG TPA: zinc-binding dehydrogenase [bacterium]|nr:zinc-binding dehydrogenase [bacterium]